MTQPYLILGLILVCCAMAAHADKEFLPILSTETLDPCLTTISTTPAPSTEYLVTIRNSSVPSIDYQYDAVGILQLLLQVTNSMTTALPQFLQEYQLKHDTHQWKLSHACSTLILPTGLVYLELYEHRTQSTIYLFE